MELKWNWSYRATPKFTQKFTFNDVKGVSTLDTDS